MSDFLLELGIVIGGTIGLIFGAATFLEYLMFELDESWWKAER